LNANSNRANAHVRLSSLILIQIFPSAKQMHAMMMTKHFIYLTSMGCYSLQENFPVDPKSSCNIKSLNQAILE
jgi:hypothetical protein